MYLICHTKEREERGKRTKIKHSKKGILQEGGGLWREQTHGITGSGNCSQGMKRLQRTILDWCSYPVVLSFIEW